MAYSRHGRRIRLQKRTADQPAEQLVSILIVCRVAMMQRLSTRSRCEQELRLETRMKAAVLARDGRAPTCDQTCWLAKACKILSLSLSPLKFRIIFGPRAPPRAGLGRIKVRRVTKKTIS